MHTCNKCRLAFLCSIFGIQTTLILYNLKNLFAIDVYCTITHILYFVSVLLKAQQQRERSQYTNIVEEINKIQLELQQLPQETNEASLLCNNQYTY